MSLFIFIILIATYILSVMFRIFLQSPLQVLKYAVLDVYHYFAWKLYNKYEAGKLNSYNAHFGGGKTLSLTHYVRYLVKRYHNKTYYDVSRGIWVIQKMLVMSNVKINDVPFEYMTSLKQLVNAAWINKDIDMAQNTRTCIICSLDELSSELNSRNFKTNIDPDFLNTLITCRHFSVSFYYTSQKHKLVDALLRSVTQNCIWCEKRWRFIVQYFYDADEMECVTNPKMLEPLKITGFFATDEDFNAYDTLAVVEHLDKDTRNGDMLSAQEILALRGDFYADHDSVSMPSRKLRRQRKR